MQHLQTVNPSAKDRLIAAAVIGSLLAFCGSANAAIDTSGVTALFTDGGAAAAVIGGAALLFAIGIVIYKRVRAAA